MLYFDGGAILKSPGKIRNWGRWSDTIDVRLPDTDFVVWVRLQNIYVIYSSRRGRNSGKQNYLRW